MDNNKGFTLIEVMVVIVILTILAAVITTAAIAHIDNSKQAVCNVNRMQLAKMYNVDLLIDGEEYSEINFSQYLKRYSNRLCPAGGSYSFSNEILECSIHSKSTIDDNNQSNDTDDEVPFF